MKLRCAASRRGQPCKAPAYGPSKYCWTHGGAFEWPYTRIRGAWVPLGEPEAGEPYLRDLDSFMRDCRVVREIAEDKAKLLVS